MAAQGQGMRRRAGESSNMYEAANAPTRAHKTSDEAMADHAAAGSARVPMGAAPVLKGTQVARKNVQAGDPTIADKGNRTNISQEKLGARYGISVGMPAPHDPAAGATQANGRLVKSAIKRSDSFVGGESDALA